MTHTEVRATKQIKATVNSDYSPSNAERESETANVFLTTVNSEGPSAQQDAWIDVTSSPEELMYEFSLGSVTMTLSQTMASLEPDFLQATRAFAKSSI